MIAVDTKILVYAHRRDSCWHIPAVRTLESLAAGRDAWAIPWPCVHEFYAIATHPRIYAPPSTPVQAIAQLRAWREYQPRPVAEDDPYWPVLESLIERCT